VLLIMIWILGNVNGLDFGSVWDMGNILTNKRSSTLWSLHRDEWYKWDIKKDTKIGMFDKIVWDLNVLDNINLVLSVWTDTDYTISLWKNSSLNIWTNDNIWKIKANNSNVLEADPSVEILSIEWIIKTIKLWVNNSIENINVVVDNLTLRTSTDITNIVAVVKNNLDLWVNNSIEKARLYVYNDINSSVSSDFAWKITVFGNLNMRTNWSSDGNICVINKIKLWVSADINTYTKEWLYGNLYPLININYSDNSEEATLVENKSKDFDWRIKTIIGEIQKAVNNMSYYKIKLTNKLKEENPDEYTNYYSKYSNYKVKVTTLKNTWIEYVNKTFDELKQYIQQDKKPLNIYEKIRFMYIWAVKNVDLAIVANICSNDIVWGVNSSYSLNWNDIKIWDISIKREVVIKWKLEEKINNILWNIKSKDKEKLLMIKSKFGKLVPKFAKKWNKKLVNAVMDINSLIDNMLLYQE